jgi:membrane protease YdiL (CAAX protease family)
MDNKHLWRFLGLSFAIGWLCMGIAYRMGLESKGRPWLLLAMWAPLAAALLAGWQTRRALWPRMRKAAWWFWPLALAAGGSFAAGQQLLLAVLAEGHWNSSLFLMNAHGSGIDSTHHVLMVLGGGQQGWPLFAVNLLLSLSVSSLMTMVLCTIGEEGGWRGVLQMELQHRFGVIKGTVLTGLIWGYWHLPVNMAGLNDMHHPILQSLVIFPLLAVSMSFLLAWLANRSGSIWPGALAHSANNTVLACMMVSPASWLADQGTAVVMAILVGGFFAWLLGKDVKRKPRSQANPARHTTQFGVRSDAVMQIADLPKRL